MAVVELEKCCKYFEEVEAVKNLSFKVESGEFFYILGPSGCGKTTTLRTIAGLEHQNEGNIYIDGKEVSDIPPNKRDVGFVFQNYALFPHMTVKENIEFGLKMNNIPLDDKKVEEQLKLVGLEGYENRKPSQLSGGEKQRVSLCRNLVLEPKVLLLDEPLSNLDAKLRRRMRIELKKIQRETGITTICVTHDQEEALSTGDRILLMKQGKGIQLGSPYKIYSKPKNRFVAEFMGQTNCFEGSIEEIIENDRVRISSPLASKLIVEVENGKELKEGENIFFLISKENISIVSKEDTDIEWQNHLEVEILVSIYMGSHVEYVAKLLESDEQIKFTISSKEHESMLPGEGEEVKLGFDAEDINIIDSNR